MGRESQSYRQDVDWLRALAVVAVIGFHFEFTGFRGGYVGVDVFFVISGFLIGRIVQTELAAETFSFSNFYERRIRRIVPALYVMVAIVWLVGAVVLLGTEKAEFQRSILAVVTFTSNILFWSQSGYFDRASAEKPLLHTWSLGIEEQFYLILPILLWALVKLRSTVGLRTVIVVVGVASFWQSTSLVSSDRSAAFFLIQSRAWELLLGTALVWMPALRAPWLARVARVAGLALIVAAIQAFPAGAPFPGINALLPCMGAALFILAGPVTWRMPPVELIGKMSYSLYLWHWPVYTLAKLRSLTLTLTLSEKIALLGLLGVVSYASYRLIELPVRSSTMKRAAVFKLAGMATALLLVTAGVGAWWPTAASRDDATVASLKAYDALAGERDRPCHTEDWTADNHADCLSAIGDKRTVLVWGDSLADHFMPGLAHYASGGVALLQANAAGCFPTFASLKQFGFCDTLAQRVKIFVRDRPPSLTIISGDWVGYAKRIGVDAMIADLQSTIAALNAPVALMGPSVQFKGRLPALLMRARLRDVMLPASDVVLDGLYDLDDKMRRAFDGMPNVFYQSPLNVICPERVCLLTVGDGVPVTWDHGHLTADASKFIINSLGPSIFGAYASAR